jgi:cytochrome c556
MLTGRSRLTASVSIVLLGVLASQCSRPAPAPPAGQALLGDMKAVVSVRELMKYMIDPIADNIFDAVWTDITPKGIIEHMPKTDDDWENVKVGAVTIAEGVYLLKVPRPFTPPGDVNNSTGPNPPELSPTQIQAKLDADPVLWDAKIEALRNVALEVLEIVKKKDVDELFQAGEDLDKACESCHLEYWYPGDRAAVEEDARQKARFEKPGRPTTAAAPGGSEKK